MGREMEGGSSYSPSISSPPETLHNVFPARKVKSAAGRDFGGTTLTPGRF